MQSSDSCKELVSLAKKITKHQCFLKSKAVQLTRERGDEMPGASEGGRCGRTLVLAQTRPRVALLLLLLRTGARSPGPLHVFVGSRAAEVPWAQQVWQCLIRASLTRFEGSSFHRLLSQEVTHLSTGSFKVSHPQISSNFPHSDPQPREEKGQ